MAPWFFENVKAEKADAMRRYNRQKIFWNFLPVLEAVVVAIVLISWFLSTWMTPIATLEIIDQYLRQLTGCLNRGIVLFAFVNALILVIFFLSHLKKPIEADLYDQYVSFASATATTATNSATVVVNKSPAPEETDTYEDKQIVLISAANAVSICPENRETVRLVNSGREAIPQANKEKVRTVSSVVKAVPARREMVRAVSSVSDAVCPRERAKTVLRPAVEEIKYRRTRSERLDRRNSCREIQRWCAIDDLSSEEFRMTVETFIAAKKKTLLQETIAEVKADAGVVLWKEGW